MRSQERSGIEVQAPPTRAPQQGGLGTETPRTFPQLVDQIRLEMGPRLFLPRRHGRGDEAPLSYGEFCSQVQDLARGLMAMGMKKGDRIGLLAENSANWLLADMAIAYAGGVDVPRGVDTAPEELREILQHAGCRGVLAETEALAREIEAMRPQLPELDFICSLESDLPDIMQRGREETAIAELEKASAAVQPADLITIVYTSGTTAQAKGVMLSHSNVVSNILAVREFLQVTPEDVFLSMLPAWHVYERIMDYLAFAAGAQLVYSDQRRLKDDLRQVRPTMFAGVPRIWENLHDGILNHSRKMKGWRRRLLQSALHSCLQVGQGDAGLWRCLCHKIFQRTVLPSLLASTGGRLRVAVSGGGALPPHVDACLLGMGIPLLNGYGLTETSPVVCVRPPHDNRAGSIGVPIAQTQVQIRSEEGKVLPQGKTGLLWIHGPQVMRGYYRNLQLSQQVLDEEGWFNSGDLGHQDAQGHFHITGRAKDTIVLTSGENVEPEPLETSIKTSVLVDQAVIVGQDQKSLGAILIPMVETLEKVLPRSQWGEQGGYLNGKAVQDLFRRELDRSLCRETGFRPCEKVPRFRLRLEPLSVENGLLTPTLKIRRHVLQQQLATDIDAMFR